MTKEPLPPPLATDELDAAQREIAALPQEEQDRLERDGREAVRSALERFKKDLQSLPGVFDLTPENTAAVVAAQERQFAKPPEYRTLSPGEVLQEGDEWRGNRDTWYPTSCVGTLVGKDEDAEYRRPVKQSGA